MENSLQIDLKTDDFSDEEKRSIVEMVCQHYANDIRSRAEWVEDRAQDVRMYEAVAPSIIEGLEKADWQSDRNLGLCPASCDAYQATLLGTTYNPDTIHFIADESTDYDNKEDLAKFTKWGLSEQEADFFPEVDDFIHNRITNGVSYFYIYWDVRYEWIDRRIPKYSDNKFLGYDKVTERKRFERGVIENIANVEDLVFPPHGNTLQKKPHLIYVLHGTMGDILEKIENKEYVEIGENVTQKFRKSIYDKLMSSQSEKLQQMGIREDTDINIKNYSGHPVDRHLWFGPYEKNGKKEEYRFIIELTTRTFLSGKPLRKITRSGKRPFVGGALIRRPGLVEGKSLPRLISDVVNQINNIYNQKADFQYIENVPFGFYDPDEAHMKQIQDIAPGKMFPTSDPKGVNFPNLSRSLAWADRDLAFLLDMLERLTGAASFFQSRQNQSETLGQDKLIAQNSETRFGLWVKRIIDDICEAITLWINMYQDWAPPDLSNRVLGENGRKLFENLSIETLRGNFRARMTPDVIGGSKIFEREVALWGFQNLQATVWFNPQLNPRGNWNLVLDAARKIGYTDAERWMPPQPPALYGRTERVNEIITKLKQGQTPELLPTDNPMEIFAGLQQFQTERLDELDKEYVPNLKVMMFNTYALIIKQVKQFEEQRMVNQMALQMVQKLEDRGVSRGGPQQPNPGMPKEEAAFPMAGNR